MISNQLGEPNFSFSELAFPFSKVYIVTPSIHANAVRFQPNICLNVDSDLLLKPNCKTGLNFKCLTLYELENIIGSSI